MTHRDRGQVPSVVEVDSAAENLKTPVEPAIVQKTMDVSEEIAGNEQVADSIGSSFEDLFGVSTFSREPFLSYLDPTRI